MSLTVAVACVALLQTVAPAQTDVVTADHIRSSFAGVVQIAEHERSSGDTGLVLQTVAPPDDHLLARFHASYREWLVYLIHFARGFQLPELDQPDGSVVRTGQGNTALLQQEFVRRLAADSQFNAVAIPAIAAHLRQSGIPVDTGLYEIPRDTITLDRAMLVAVRFFYPDVIVDGNIRTHVCAELNAVRELPTRNLALEAMAFSAIMSELRRGPSTRMQVDLRSAADLMKLLDAPGPDELRLQRAQGVMWGMMHRSVGVREILMAESQHMNGILPFVIGHE